jgi:tripartite-type tricarboxylate transporter receptor subunit TctC
VRRRQFIAFLGSGAVAWPLTAHAQGGSTSQNIRLVVGFSAGGATDIAARVLAGSLSQQVFLKDAMVAVDRTKSLVI